MRIVLGSASISSPTARARALAALGRVAAGVEDEPVQPGRELRIAAELRQPDAELRERLLCRVASVLRVAQDVSGEPLDLRGMTGEEGLERLLVAVFCARDEDRVAELLVGKPFAQGLPSAGAPRTGLVSTGCPT